MPSLAGTALLVLLSPRPGPPWVLPSQAVGPEAHPSESCWCARQCDTPCRTVNFTWQLGWATVPRYVGKLQSRAFREGIFQKPVDSEENRLSRTLGVGLVQSAEGLRRGGPRSTEKAAAASPPCSLTAGLPCGLRTCSPRPVLGSHLPPSFRVTVFLENPDWSLPG